MLSFIITQQPHKTVFFFYQNQITRNLVLFGRKTFEMG